MVRSEVNAFEYYSYATSHLLDPMNGLESAGARTNVPEIAEIRMQLQKMLASATFAQSNRMVRFLRFAVEKSLDGQFADLKETAIAVEVFDRSPDYDPKADPVVRKEAGRLRAKLDEYYGSEGLNDKIRISLPKGGYVATFESQQILSVLPQEFAVAETAIPELRQQANWLQRRRLLFFTGFLILIAVGTFAALRWARPASPTHVFWKRFLTERSKTLVVPGDSGLVMLENFAGRTLTLDEYLHRENRSLVTPRAGISPEVLADTSQRRYTSIADLNAVARLLRLPEATGKQIAVKYVRDLQSSDLRDSNVILLGAVEADPWIELFEKDLNFIFIKDQVRNEFHVRNRNPLSGEQPDYHFALNDPHHRAYGSIAFISNLNRDGSVLIIQGTTMAGLEAAMEFLLGDSLLQPVIQQARQSGGTLRHFEVLVEGRYLEATAPETKELALRIY